MSLTPIMTSVIHCQFPTQTINIEYGLKRFFAEVVPSSYCLQQKNKWRNRAQNRPRAVTAQSLQGLASLACTMWKCTSQLDHVDDCDGLDFGIDDHYTYATVRHAKALLYDESLEI